MTYKPNPLIVRRVEKFGETVDLPLFDGIDARFQNIPKWIWDGSRIKAEAYNQMKEKLSESILKVLIAFINQGGKASDNDICKATNIPVHIVSARRNDLQEIGLIYSHGEKKKLGPYSKPNTLWSVNFKSLHDFLN